MEHSLLVQASDCALYPATCTLDQDRIGHVWLALSRLWDMETGQCHETLQIGMPVTSLLICSDGKHLGAGCQDGAIRCVKRTPLMFCCNLLKRHLMSFFDFTHRLWDLESNECSAVLEGYGAPISALCKADGNSILSGSADGTVRCVCFWLSENSNCVPCVPPVA